MWSRLSLSQTPSSNRSNEFSRLSSSAFTRQHLLKRPLFDDEERISASQRRNRHKRDEKRIQKLNRIPTFLPRIIDRDFVIPQTPNYYISDVHPQGIPPSTENCQFNGIGNLVDIHNPYDPFGAVTYTDNDGPDGPIFVFTKVERKAAINRIGGKALKTLLGALDFITTNEIRASRGKNMGEIFTFLPHSSQGRGQKRSTKKARVDSGNSSGHNVLHEGQYVSVGLTSNVTSYGISMKNLKCEAEQDEQEIPVGDVMALYQNKLGQLLSEYSYPAVNRVLKKVLNDGNAWSTIKSGTDVDPLPSMVVGESVFLPLHTDCDVGLGVISVHCEDDTNFIHGDTSLLEYSVDSPVIAYIVFPSYHIKVPLRAGDVLIFNSQVPHCISSPNASHINTRYFVTSASLKRSVASLRDNRIPYTA